jgi:hypothetical protein
MMMMILISIVCRFQRMHWNFGTHPLVSCTTQCALEKAASPVLPEPSIGRLARYAY